VFLECGGVPMLPLEAAGSLGNGTAAGTPEVSILLGKRYEHPGHGVEVLCTKPGLGPLSVSGEEMSVKGAKPLPSSD
jgi:hypothetical protein